MDFRKKVAIVNAVCSWNWHGGDLNIFVNDGDYAKFKKVLDVETNYFDDEEVKAVVRQDCICILPFDKVLNDAGLTQSEIKEMFD